MCKKDYRLLRKFDLEAAKRGELLTTENRDFDGEPVWKYAAGPDADGKISVFVLKDGKFAYPALIGSFRMAPLCWVEGKPVYKGDVLWHNTFVEVTAADKRKDNIEGFVCTDGDHVSAINLSWRRMPKVKREAWVNIYKNSNNAYKHVTREKADNTARLVNGIIDPDRVACIHIEWEE